MAMSDWSTTASSNGTTLGINIAENCPAANINNAIREMMAELRAAITTADATIEGNASVGGAFSVTGNATFGGTLGVTGAVTLSGAISATNGTFSGNGSFGGTLAATGNTTLGGTLGVTGAATFSSTLAVTSGLSVGGGFTVGGDATISGVFSALANVSLQGTTYFGSSLHGNIASDTNTIYVRGNTISLQNTDASQTYATLTAAAFSTLGIVKPGGDTNFYLSLNSGTPLLQWDSGDYDFYDRSGNVRYWAIGSSAKLSLSASGLFDGSGNKYWNAGNDGSGSGLDADLLDGHDSVEFVRVTASSIIQNGGYRVYSDGLIETWGYITIGADSTGTYNLPVAHSSWVVPVISSYWPADQTSSAHAVDWSSTNGSPPSSISFRNADDRTVTVWIQTKGA